jgi:hypothetical protein
MYEMAPESWQDWLSLVTGGVVIVFIAWRVLKTPPMR